MILNLLNKIGKKVNARLYQAFYRFFLNKFDKINNTGAQMLDSIYHMKPKKF